MVELERTGSAMSFLGKTMNKTNHDKNSGKITELAGKCA